MPSTEFKHSAIALAILAVVGSARASDDYRCRIDRVHNAAGEDADSFVHVERKKLIGKEFSVSRKTGAMSGSLRNDYWNGPNIIDRGSKENSLKIVTTVRPGDGGGPGSSIYALVINEYVEGPEKRFVFLSSDTAYFGICMHDK